MTNINTKSYWDLRFKTGDWEGKHGREQTNMFAKSQLQYIDLPANFDGSLLDFGCGLGDAIPLYSSAFPFAKLCGIDISEYAIDYCRNKYGNLAEFICGDYTAVPKVDIIIASNVFEHLDEEYNVVQHLLNNCSNLYVIVPFNEQEPLSPEHIRTYNKNSFNDFKVKKFIIYSSVGWSEGGWKELFYNIYFKNIIKILLGKKVRYKRKQILYRITSN
jgi:SAM-dependent methyltransferase